jgi:uncharacterized ferritin-like protein (DUF455 family)
MTDDLQDDRLFAPGPARDERFVVKQRWVECDDLPHDHPLHHVEFLHRQMNEEQNGLECSARSLADFPEVDWQLRMQLARQCADEARHCTLFRRLLERRGGHVGQFPVLNFQYRIINHAPTLVGRLAIQNRSFEAGGIDAIAWGLAQADAQDDDLTELFETQLADEILHVRFANDWIRRMIREQPGLAIRMGAAMATAADAFASVMGHEGTDGAGYPADRAARLEAGFTPDEVTVAEQLAAAKVHQDGAAL